MNRFSIIIVGLMFMLVIVLVQSKAVTQYTETLASVATQSNKSSDPLYQKIVEHAKTIHADAIEPRVDSIWKIIPGYNGITLDVDATYKQANKKTGTYYPVINEITPQKTVWDLPPNPIYRGNSNKKMVALMINVAWGNEHLESMLQTLRERQVKATFFLDGSWLTKNPDHAKLIVADGHEIGSHAYSHPNMSRITTERIIQELEKTNDRIKEVLGLDVRLFAPPSGDFDSRVVQLAWERKMLTILWTLDTVDWRKPPVAQMVNKIVSNVDAGYLILMHPTYATANGLDAMITGIIEKGYAIDIVSNVISSMRENKVEIPTDF